jgi:Dienelactone hydrolase family
MRLVCLRVTTLCAVSGAVLSAQIPRGSQPVGFRAFVQYDYSRTYRATYDAKGDSVRGEHARPIQTSVWYPATLVAGERAMRYADYVVTSALDEGSVPLDASHRRAQLVNFAAALAWSVPDFERLVSRSVAAYRNARPAPGRFPVVIYGPSIQSESWENAVLCERLASHGYVVIASPALGVYQRTQSLSLASVDAEARDMEFLIGYAHTLSYADADHIGVMGFSWGGLANVIVALRNPSVRAVVSLDGSIRYWYQFIQNEWYGDPARLVSPFLFLSAATIPDSLARFEGLSISGRAFPFYDSVRYADEYYLTFEKMQHRDFGSFFALANDSPSVASQRSYELAGTYAIQFLDAYLKGDARGRAFLDRTPEANGAPAGWVIAAAKRGREPHADLGAFVHYVRAHGGWAHAAEALATIRQTDPGYRVDEQDLSDFASVLTDDNDAIAAFAIDTAMHPTSTDAYYGLGEAYATHGDTTRAIANLKRAVALDSTNAVARSEIARLSDSTGRR